MSGGLAATRSVCSAGYYVRNADLHGQLQRPAPTRMAVSFDCVRPVGPKTAIMSVGVVSTVGFAAEPSPKLPGSGVKRVAVGAPRLIWKDQPSLDVVFVSDLQPQCQVVDSQI